MATIKSFTDISQSKTLSKILPPESADMCWGIDVNSEPLCYNNSPYPLPWKDYTAKKYYVPCWSLNALIELLPEIKGTPFVIQKFKTENNNYYNLEYEGIIMLPYCKSLVDGCVEMIEKLKKENLI